MKMVDGMISGLETEIDSNSYRSVANKVFQVGFEVTSSMAGAPVFKNDGGFVGLLVESKLESVGFTCRSSEIVKFLKEAEENLQKQALQLH